jgi:hypothetical protein
MCKVLADEGRAHGPRNKICGLFHLQHFQAFSA